MSGPTVIKVDYEVNIDPQPIGATIGIASNNTKIIAKVDSVNDFSVSFKPSGNVSEKIQSGLLFPLSATLGGLAKSKIKDQIEGKESTVYTIEPITLNAEGMVLTLTPSNIELSTYESQLLITTDFTIS